MELFHIGLLPLSRGTACNKWIMEVCFSCILSDMKRMKFYYVPGLISLMGLPVLLFIWGPSDPVFRTAMRLRLPSDEAASGIGFTREGFLQLTKNKRILTIDLEDLPIYPREADESARDHRFHFVKQEIQRLQFTHDTSTILRIGLGEDNTYGDFVWLCNYMTISAIKRYAVIDDNFYILSNPPRDDYGLASIQVDIPDSMYQATLQTISKWESFKWYLYCKWYPIKIYLVACIKYNQLLITGFLLLIILPAMLRLSFRR